MSRTSKGNLGTCTPRRAGELTTIRAIVHDYIATLCPRPWFAFHSDQPSLQRALDVVATWKDRCGKVYSHQRRLSKAAKAGAGARIRKLKLDDVQSFEELLRRVEKAISSIRGIGDLAVYDAALRIGTCLGILPERVYLQSGARVGAHALGLDASQRSLPMDVFPAEFQRLEPWEVEDVLCIYERELGRVARRRHAAA